MSNSNLGNLKVKSFFAYHEERVSDTEVNFGWIPSKKDSLESPFIVSYGSRSKNITEEDLRWSKDAGVNAASLSDYLKYFKSLTGDSPEDFHSKWSSDLDSLEKIRQDLNPNYRAGEGKFLLSLSNLLLNGTKFSQYGRIFKLIAEET